MPKKLVFIHTIAGLVDTFGSLSKELLEPEVTVVHVADEIILKEIQTKEKLTPMVYRRVSEHVIDAEDSGADGVMLTCSSIGESSETAQRMVDIPVMRVDEAMARKAVATGSKIGVAATATTTLGPTTNMVKKVAASEGKEVTVEAVLCEGAYEAMITKEPM